MADDAMHPVDDLTKRTPFVACQADARCSYCLYVPETIHHVLVYVHGTERDAAYYRNHLADFAEANNVLIVAPLFPAGLIDPHDVDNYKVLRFHDMRFDLILFDMLREIRDKYSIMERQFLLGGFSGGAQFAHRFSYFYGAHLLGLSIATPGRVTLLNNRYDWWVGIRNIAGMFERPIHREAMRDLPVQLLIGSDDNKDITIIPDSPYWTDGANLAGTTRAARLNALHYQYEQLHADVSMHIVPECAHVWLPAIIHFFERIIRNNP